jgi:TrmH family RNA methyltransferase
MKIQPITSAQNAVLKRIRGLHQRSAREKEGLFLIEGAKVLNEAFAKDLPIHDVVVSKSFWTEGLPQLAQDRVAQLHIVEDKMFKELTTTQTPCGVVAVGSSKHSSLEDCLKDCQTLMVVADAIQDPGNVGTLIRAALAFGATGMVLGKGSVDVYNPKVVRSAMGALFSLPIVVGMEAKAAITRLKAKGVRVLALEASAAKRVDSSDLTGAIAIVLGNEGGGLSPEVFLDADERISIPMSALVESLNVGVCGAIVLYQCALARGKNQ